MTHREKDQADFDLERFIDLFDEAMTSKDPRVMETLRSLMMIVTLTRPEAKSTMMDRNSGPLRRLYEDMHNLNRSMSRMQEELQDIRRGNQPYRWEAEDKYTMASSSAMSRQIDQDVLDKMKWHHQQVQAAKVINGGYTLGPENKAKGLK